MDDGEYATLTGRVFLAIRSAGKSDPWIDAASDACFCPGSESGWPRRPGTACAGDKGSIQENRGAPAALQPDESTVDLVRTDLLRPHAVRKVAIFVAVALCFVGACGPRRRGARTPQIPNRAPRATLR